MLTDAKVDLNLLTKISHKHSYNKKTINLLNLHSVKKYLLVMPLMSLFT